MSSTPLRDRVVAPIDVRLPASVRDVMFRPARENDAPVLHELERVAGRIDHPGFVTALEQFELDLTRPELDLAHDTLIGFDVAGTAVAWAYTTLLPGVDTVVRVAVPGVVHPARRGEGIGTALMRWHDERGRQLLASSPERAPGWLATWADAAAADRIGIYRSWGYESRRWWTEMSRDLSLPIDEAAGVTGVDVAPWASELSERIRVAHNEAFHDHWGFVPVLRNEWDAQLTLPTFASSQSWVALDTQTRDVIAYVLSSARAGEQTTTAESVGSIDFLGVRRSWRGHGLGRALLTRAMLSHCASGRVRLELDVDSANPTGATHLYDSLGFAPINRTVTLVKEF